MCDKQQITEEPCNGKLLRTVLKSSGSREGVTDFNAVTGDKCVRGQQVGSLNLYLWSDFGLGKLVKSPSGKVYDASENAARNIGIKYLAHKFEKPMMYKPQGLEDVVISWLPYTSAKGNVVTLPTWYVLSLSCA
jgi:putative transposase